MPREQIVSSNSVRVNPITKVFSVPEGVVIRDRRAVMYVSVGFRALCVANPFTHLAQRAHCFHCVYTNKLYTDNVLD